MKILEDIKALQNGTLGRKLTVIFSLAVIAISLISLWYTSLSRSFVYDEFDPYQFYVAGKLWNEGENVYDLQTYRDRIVAVAGQDVAGRNNSGLFYPPQAVAWFSAFSHATFESAHLAMLIVYIVLLIVSGILLGYILSWFRPIGLPEIALLGLLLSTGYGRATIRSLHMSPVIFILLLLMFILVRQNRNTWAGGALGLVSFKPTFIPLYLVYYFLRRNFRLVAACLVTGLVFTILPLVLTQRPIGDYLTDWSAMLGSAGGDVNDPSPFIPWSATLIHLQPLIYRLFNQQSTFTTLISYGLIILSGIYIGYLSFLHDRRNDPNTDENRLIEFSLVSAMSLLAIYHRNYDVFLLFPGLIYLYLYISRLTARPRQYLWSAFYAIILISLALPGNLLIDFSLRSPALADNYFWRLIMPFQIWVSVAVLVALLWLRTREVMAARVGQTAPVYTEA